MSKLVPLPDAAYLRVCLHYDMRAGELRWRTRPPEHFADRRGHWVHNGRWAGQIAGTPKSKGIIVRLNNYGWRSARIIWRMVTGDDPGEHAVDHIDRNPFNNAWDNLRLATHGQNRRNSLANRNRALPKGVYYDQRLVTNPYRVIIRVDKRSRSLGSFPTVEAARFAYLQAAASIPHLNPG